LPENMSIHPELSRKQVLDMQREFIIEYSDQEFQERLHAALNAVGSNHARQNKARQEVCLPIQSRVISKYGFEPTRRGVMESFYAVTDELKVDPEVAANMAKMSILVERYALPDEKWRTWPTTGTGLYDPIIEMTLGNVPISLPRSSTPEDLAEAKVLELKNKLAWAGVGLESPVSHHEPDVHPVQEPTLTRQQIIEIQDALIQEYQKKEFQDKLHAAMAAAGSDPVAQLHARQAVCLPIQGPIVAKYGFEPSLRGVQQTLSFLTDDLISDPDIVANLETMSVLVERHDLHLERNRVRDTKTSAERAFNYADLTSRHPALQVEPAEGRLWKVVGGAQHHGLVVRKGKDLSSPQLGHDNHDARLSTDAVVREIELVGERLHYRKITGDGPEFGWVSINLHGSALLKPAAGGLTVR